MAEESLSRIRQAQERVRQAVDVHEALQQELKDVQTRKREAFKELARRREELRQAVRKAVAEGTHSKTEIAEAADVSRVVLYTYLDDKK